MARPSASRTRTPRRVVVVDNRPLARQIGERLRAARLRAGLSQRQLAGDRYTSSYVSALELGNAKPSMAALSYLAERLGVAVPTLLRDAGQTWSRLEADVLLASGEWQRALDAYQQLIGDATDRGARAEALRGTAEALCRLNRGSDAIAPASEAVELFAALQRRADVAYANYWLSYAHYLVDNTAEARAIILEVLAETRRGLEVQGDFKLRALVAAASIESWDGEDERALAYLEEARALTAGLDDRRRAAFLFSLALAYHATADLEAAVRTGTQSLGLFQAAQADSEIGSLDNNLALIYLALGNVKRARELAAGARALAGRYGDTGLLAHIADTDAQIALADGDPVEAQRRTEEAIELGEAAGNRLAQAGAFVTRARVQLREGEATQAGDEFRRAIELLRAHGSPGRVRRVLAEWADALAAAGEHERATELYREALASRPTR